MSTSPHPAPATPGWHVADAYAWFTAAAGRRVVGAHCTPSATPCPAPATPGSGARHLSVALRNSQKDIVCNKSRSSVTSVSLDSSCCSRVVGSAPLDASVVVSVTLNAPQTTLHMRKDSGEGGKTRYVLELVDNASAAQLRVIYVDPKLHGDVIVDGWFGAFDVSPDDRYFAYVAEDKPAETSSWFETMALDESKRGRAELVHADAARVWPCEKDAPHVGRAFEYSLHGGVAPGFARETWGEKYENVRCPRIYIADLLTGRVALAPGQDADASYGQPTWAAATAAAVAAASAPYVLMATVWPHATQRLGMIYCYNRPASVQMIDLCTWLRAMVDAPPPATPTAASSGASRGDTTGSETPAPAVATDALCSWLTLSLPEEVARSPKVLRIDGARGVYTVVYLAMTAAGLHVHNAGSALVHVTVQRTLTADASLGASLAVVTRSVWLPTVSVPSHPLPQCVATNSAAAQPDSVDAPALTAPLWPGLYLDVLAKRCYHAATDSLFVASHCHFRQALLALNMSSAAASDAPHNRVTEIVVPTAALLTALGASPDDVATRVRDARLPAASLTLLSVADVDDKPFLLVTASLPHMPDVPLLLTPTATGAWTWRVLSSDLVTPYARHVATAGREDDSWVSRLPPTHTSLRAAAAGVHFRLLSFRGPPVPAAAGVAKKEATPEAAVETMLLYSLQPTVAAAAEEDAPRGLVMVPHGGPHSAYSADFYLPYVFLASQGFVVALVNFRGSLGYGEAATACLAGRIGELDVADVHAATLAACALGGDEAAACELCGLYPGYVEEAHVAPNLVPALPLRVSQARVGIMGGSHGGYLTAHAIGRFPKLYRAACLRNPVIDVASMIGSTDIADWCATEALGCDTYHAYTQGTLPYPTPDMLAHMHATSPIATVHAVEAAVLVMLGLKDKRVPAFQGLQYYNLLRARRVTTRLLAYPEDCHAIDKPASEADAWVNMAQWLLAHM